MRPFPTVVVVHLLLLLLGCLRGCCLAKELVATHQWQLLQKNDTVAAGMHVRIDMTTGEKWVKLPDDDTDKQQQTLQQVTVSETGTSEPVSTTYDFDMMYRTLSKLPEEEQIRMGLPQQQPNNNNNEEQLTQFQSTLLRIWTDRQEQLQYYDQTADLPQILKDRIHSLQVYLDHPSAFLLSPESNDLDFSNNPIAVVKDLEQLLQDVDNTRDFYTLGGWMLLVKMLHRQSHNAIHNTTTTTTTTPPQVLEQQQQRVLELQSLAAWALGTAVKNTAEFGPYVLEPMKNGEEGRTALSLVLDQYQRYLDHPLDVRSFRLYQKLVYCLGSFLRGNQAAMQVFIEQLDGPNRFIASGLEIAVTHADRTTSVHQKITDKLLKLAMDAIHEYQHVTESVVKAWASPNMCGVVLQCFQSMAARTPPVAPERTILEVVQAYQPYCQWTEHEVRDTASQIQEKWKDQPHHDNVDIHNEGLELLAAIAAR